MGHRRTWAAIALLIASVTGCSGGGPAGAADVVLPVAAVGAGRPIADGIRVLEGTVLVGPPMPTVTSHYSYGVPVPDDGWVAVLEVEGSLAAATRDYLRQASQLGMTSRGGQALALTPAGGPRDGTCATVRGVTRCAGLARNEDRQRPRSLTVEATRGAVGGEAFSALYLRYSTSQLYFDYGTSSAGPATAALHEPGATWSARPRTGQHFPQGWSELRHLRIPPGTVAVAPVGPNPSCGVIGGYAVLRVTASPEAVLDGYAKQLASLNAAPYSGPTVHELGHGVREHELLGSQAGGDSYELRLLERDGADGWLHIVTCTD